MRGWLSAWFLVLLGGCGGESGREVPPIPPLPETPAAEVPEPPEPEPRREAPGKETKALVESLRARRDEARARLDALPERHREEMRELGDLAPLRAQERKLIVTAKRARIQIEYYEEKQGPVDPEVEALAEQADKLQAKCDSLEEKLDERRRATTQVILDAELRESPVALELRRIRSAQEKWFELTRPARAKRVYPTVRKRISAAYREWVEGVPGMRRVVEAALEFQPARGRKGYERFDFCDYRFFILCQLLEDDLDRRNVVVERDRMAELRKAVDAASERIDEAEAELAALKARPLWQKVVASDVGRSKLRLLRLQLELGERRLGEVQARLAPARELEKRQEKEFAEAEAAVAEAARLLAEARYDLSR